MSNNHKEQYSYYCTTEQKWIFEERDKGSVPTQCKNDSNHIIKTSTISLAVGNYCYYVDNTNIPELFDLNTFDYNNLTANEKKLLQLIRSLLLCASYRNLVIMN